MKHVLRLDLSVASAILLAFQIQASATPLTIEIQVNGEQDVLIEDQPVGGGVGAARVYIGQYADPDGQWTASWNYLVINDAIVGAVFDGSSQVVNTGDDYATFRMTTTTPMCPKVIGDSRIGASLSVTLLTGVGGGSMWDFDGKPIWAVIADGEEVRTVFDAPFYLGTSGAGILTLSANFGTPVPSEPSGSFAETMGLRRNFAITAGETATFNTAFSLASDFGSVTDCPLLGDVNGDGVVDGVDLLSLLSAWGECPDDPAECPADLNGDGFVDGADLLILLDNWGSGGSVIPIGVEERLGSMQWK